VPLPTDCPAVPAWLPSEPLAYLIGFVIGLCLLTVGVLVIRRHRRRQREAAGRD
jgi:hypothetical protein